MTLLSDYVTSRINLYKDYSISYVTNGNELLFILTDPSKTDTKYLFCHLEGNNCITANTAIVNLRYLNEHLFNNIYIDKFYRHKIDNNKSILFSTTRNKYQMCAYAANFQYAWSINELINAKVNSFGVRNSEIIRAYQRALDIDYAKYSFIDKMDIVVLEQKLTLEYDHTARNVSLKKDTEVDTEVITEVIKEPVDIKFIEIDESNLLPEPPVIVIPTILVAK